MLQGQSRDQRLANQNIASLWLSHWFRHVQVNQARPKRLSAGTWASLFPLLRREAVCLQLLVPILPPEQKRPPENGVNAAGSSSERENCCGVW